MAQLKGKYLEDGAVDDSKIKLTNNNYLKSRNNADSADIDAIKVNASDEIEFGSTPVVGAATVLISSDKGANSGVASLDASGKLLTAQLPALAITSTVTVADIAARLALAGGVQEGDVAVQLDTGVTYILTSAGDGSVDGHWQEVLAAGGITSVNGQAGPTVTLTTTNIAEGTNLYYTDTRAKAASVADAIVDSVTDVAPSQNAVFDALALKSNIADLAAVTNGNGASLIGIEDAAANFAATDIEAALAELQGNIGAVVGADAEDEILTISAGDITAEFKDLGFEAMAGSIHVTPVGGILQENIVDYAIALTGGVGSVTRISWTGLGLVSLLAASDKLLVKYLRA